MTRVRMECTAVLFDLDGVLVYSAAAVRRSWLHWARRHRLDPAVVWSATHGRRTVDTIRQVAPHLDAAPAAAALEAEQARETADSPAAPGAAELLSALHPSEWAVVTSGSRPLALARLRGAGLSTPALLISGDDVEHGKPDPAGYLSAARGLGVSPADCVVLEDAPAGIVAARRAGMRVVGIRGGNDPQDSREADVQASDCAALKIERDDRPGTLLLLVGE